VTLSATPASGSTFAGWSGGGCAGSGNCVVVLTSDATVTATFDLASSGPPSGDPPSSNPPSANPPASNPPSTNPPGGVTKAQKLAQKRAKARAKCKKLHGKARAKCMRQANQIGKPKKRSRTTLALEAW